MEHLAGNWSWWVTGKPTVRGLGVRLHQHYVRQSENSRMVVSEEHGGILWSVTPVNLQIDIDLHLRRAIRMKGLECLMKFR